MITKANQIMTVSNHTEGLTSGSRGGYPGLTASKARNIGSFSSPYAHLAAAAVEYRGGKVQRIRIKPGLSWTSNVAAEEDTVARPGLARSRRQRSRVHRMLTEAARAASMSARLRRRGVVTIPREVRAELDLHEGDRLMVKVLDGVVVLIPPGRAAQDDQAWYWTAEWQEAEAEADDDIQTGRVTTYDSASTFLASFDDE
jgi:AbrB family looped-hinge helix DNA binding protein